MRNLDVLRKIRQLGARGGVFQYAALRSAMGVAPDDHSSHSRLWNQFKSLEDEGYIELVPSARKRNKYYRVKDLARLEALLGQRQTTPPQPATDTAGRTGAADRLARLEAKLEEMRSELTGKLDALESKVDELAAVWS